MLGVEVDMMYDYLDQGVHSNNAELFDYGKDYQYSEVTIKDNIKNETVVGDGIPIKVTNKQEFYDGSPTRLETTGTLFISGVPWGIIGIEYLRTTPEGEGIILFNVDATLDQCIASGIHQSYMIPTDDICNHLASGVMYMSGIDPSKYIHTYDNIGRDEVLTPYTNYDLQKKYSDTIKLNLPKDGVENAILKPYTLTNWQPDGYYWDTVNDEYIPVTYPTDTYINNEGDEVYHRVSLNNPSGSGVFDTEYLELIDIPISGSLRLYDMDNLDISGVPIEIPRTGIQTYYHDGKYGVDDEQYSIYVGYSGILPHEYTPIGEVNIPTTATVITSWDYVYDGDGLNDNFEWQTDNTKPIINKIKITNPISRYIVEYDSATEDGIRYITTVNSSRYVRYDDKNYIFSSNPRGSGLVDVESSLSNEKSNRIAVTFNGLDVRPGTIVDYINLSADLKIEKSTDKPVTIPVDDNLLGAEDVMIPNIQDRRSYIFNDDLGGSLFTPAVGSLEEAIFDTYLAYRVVMSNSSLEKTTYYPLFVPNNINDRCFRTRFRLNTYNNNFVIAKSDEDNDNYWSISVENGYFIIRDAYATYYTYYLMSIDTNIKEIILVSNNQYNNTADKPKYSLFYKDGDTFFKEMKLGETEPNDYTVTTETTQCFITMDVDVEFIQMYDEQGDFNA